MNGPALEPRTLAKAEYWEVAAAAGWMVLRHPLLLGAVFAMFCALAFGLPSGLAVGVAWPLAVLTILIVPAALAQAVLDGGSRPWHEMFLALTFGPTHRVPTAAAIFVAAVLASSGVVGIILEGDALERGNRIVLALVLLGAVELVREYRAGCVVLMSRWGMPVDQAAILMRRAAERNRPLRTWLSSWAVLMVGAALISLGLTAVAWAVMVVGAVYLTLLTDRMFMPPPEPKAAGDLAMAGR